MTRACVVCARVFVMYHRRALTCGMACGMARKRQVMQSRPRTPYDVPEPIVRQKRCPSCRTVKAACEFTRNRRASSGLNVYCKRCVKRRQWARSAQDG